MWRESWVLGADGALHMCLLNHGFLSYMFNSGDSIFRKILKNLHTVLQVAVSIYIPINNARELPFLHTLSSIYCV